MVVLGPILFWKTLPAGEAGSLTENAFSERAYAKEQLPFGTSTVTSRCLAIVKESLL